MSVIIYARFDANGFPVGYYPSDVFDAAPEDAVEISIDQWREMLANPGARKLVAGEVVPYYPPEQPQPMPALTRRQLRLGLLANGITTAQVESVIAAITDPVDREVAQIEWADATTYERDHPLVDQIGMALGLSPGDIDDMWLDAATR